MFGSATDLRISVVIPIALDLKLEQTGIHSLFYMPNACSAISVIFRLSQAHVPAYYCKAPELTLNIRHPSCAFIL